jgi:1-aminocyclopropane-1-carboxylate deaminase
VNRPPTIQRLQVPEITEYQLTVDVLRLDLLHPVISGNKWFKLKAHLALALRSPGCPIITFGGAWSNHLVATAYAAKQAGLTAIGIVRGERPAKPSATLQDAESYGMQLEFISRQAYVQKMDPAFIDQLSRRFPGAYIIPEGGGGMPGVNGSGEILLQTDNRCYTHIVCAIGTGATWLGLIRAAGTGHRIIGVPVLKGSGTIAAIDREGLLGPEEFSRAGLLTGFHFGGYARHPRHLLDFMNRLYHDTGIPTDIVYTGKLFYAALTAAGQGFFPARSRLLIIHSGGLQGNRSLPPGQLDF